MKMPTVFSEKRQKTDILAVIDNQNFYDSQLHGPGAEAQVSENVVVLGGSSIETLYSSLPDLTSTYIRCYNGGQWWTWAGGQTQLDSDRGGGTTGLQ